MSIKEQLLQQLLDHKGVALSGEALAKSMRVSRTAIWKGIQALKEEGYQIEATTNKGYRLSHEGDPVSVAGIISHLAPQLKDLPLYVYKTVESTNDTAKQLALDGAPHGTTVLAFHQSKGKGRLGRAFISPLNTGVYMSVLLKPSFDLTHAPLVTTAASVAVARAIESVCKQQAEIKWVNDVYVNGKKVCGILTEAITDFETGGIQHLVLGIGINCNTEGFSEELLSIAGSVDGEFTKDQLAAEVINQLIPLIDHLEDRTFIEDYRAHSMVLGKNIKVFKGGYHPHETGVSATVLGIDNNGGLQVIYSSGERETLTSGEISIRL